MADSRKPTTTKDINKYLKSNDKTEGENPGAWFKRKTLESKQSEWLLKESSLNVPGGFRNNNENFPSNILLDIYAIKEVYAGELYRLILGEPTPKARLFTESAAQEIMSNKEMTILFKRYQNKDGHLVRNKYVNGLKKVPAFTNLEIISSKFNKLNDYLKQHFSESKLLEIHYQITKCLLVSLVLNETDMRLGNYGMSNDNFVKIDHGESLKLQYNSQGGLEFPSINISKDSLIAMDPDFLSGIVTDELILRAKNEISQFDINQIIHLAEPYERLFTEYRTAYEKEFPQIVNFIMGERHNKILETIVQRLNEFKQELEDRRETDNDNSNSLLKPK